MSLRGRLLLAAGAVALVALIAADVATYSALRSFLVHRIDQSLDAAHVAIERAVRGHRGPVLPAISAGTYIEVRDGETIFPITSGRLRNGREVTPRLPATIKNFTVPTDGFGAPTRSFTVGSAGHGGPPFRVRASLLDDGRQLILAAPLDEVRATLDRLLRIESLVTAAALLAAAALGWWLVRVGLRPLADVEATAIAIADGDLARRVPNDDAATEVGQLARAINVMLARIEEAFAQRDATEARLRRFVADASHELRTPLAAVSAYAELFDRGASTRPEDLARVIAGIRSESGRMRALVEDLLLLARLDEGRPLERQPVEMVDLAAEAVAAATAVGPQWPVQLAVDGPIEVVGDGARLRQVLDNLLANVREHTPAGTQAVVSIGRNNGEAVLEVRDNGPGLTPDAASHAFERFYRAESSRSREHGGAGLGLAIVAAIVEAHGGRVALAPAEGGGAAVTVRMPLAA
jgi:two-component system OmpR family sensor kinase